MNEIPLYRLATAAMIFLLLAIVQTARAQQSDTMQVTKELEQQELLLQRYHRDRSVGNLYLPSTGFFDVPEPTQYYTPPFMGQKYLDLALAAYYEKLKEGNSLLFRFLNAVAPFINNQFEFAVYYIYDLPIADRDQPMLYPQLNAKENETKKTEDQ